MERDEGWLGPATGSGQLQPWKEKEKGGAAAAALGSPKPSTRRPGTRGRSPGVRGGEREPCALLSASVVRA